VRDEVDVGTPQDMHRSRMHIPLVSRR